jgi:hypothetical protein
LARQGEARQGKARQGKARQGKARQGKAREKPSEFPGVFHFIRLGNFDELLTHYAPA